MQKPAKSSENLPSPPQQTPESTEQAEVVFEGGWGPGGTDIPGPPEPPPTQSSRVGAFPNLPDDDLPDPTKKIRRKPADD